MWRVHVLLDGEPSFCLVPVDHADSAEITTIELGVDHPLQRAFASTVQRNAGSAARMIMAALALPTSPTLDDVRFALAATSAGAPLPRHYRAILRT